LTGVRGSSCQGSKKARGKEQVTYVQMPGENRKGGLSDRMWGGERWSSNLERVEGEGMGGKASRDL